MTTPVTSIPNLGPATAEGFARAGVDSAEALRALGADAAYARWLAAGEPAHFIGYYALVMGLQGRPWNDCKGAEKDALKLRFEALKADTRRDRTGIEAMLDEIGVRARA
ncbi:TfoX/Sxy family DNA transformation protein [Maritimibacter sp. UBA3975]|uniref:TfoX/Sxy family DNA transformation protein n=1 Tax=Maritimibacter sp. UBA3975 TaxID=1946833 RepID=UPI000C0A237D|nr:TfoX/Sxy family DNA transformation protein [Maritimibacter sp. UBA3975]MAM60208.1 competence protein TfoX [Maritimibacter sp.]|tara:strand:- start:1827 stop:2153 length:327 start_codon:yes stop_codon:yes gene_type:complete